jgi:hypothetical protein
MAEEIHIYTTKPQPATHYTIDLGSLGIIHIRSKGRRIFWCNRCKKRRWAKYLTAQAYYDCTYFWCKSGHGCAKKTKP